MTSSLRIRVVEAGARALQPGLWTLILDDPSETDPPGMRERSLRKAARALDAFLDTLTENADEWAEEKGNRYMTDAAWYAETDEAAVVHNLLAVLRNPE